MSTHSSAIVRLLVGVDELIDALFGTLRETVSKVILVGRVTGVIDHPLCKALDATLRFRVGSVEIVSSHGFLSRFCWLSRCCVHGCFLLLDYRLGVDLLHFFFRLRLLDLLPSLNLLRARALDLFLVRVNDLLGLRGRLCLFPRWFHLLRRLLVHALGLIITLHLHLHALGEGHLLGDDGLALLVLHHEVVILGRLVLFLRLGELGGLEPVENRIALGTLLKGLCHSRQSL